MLSARPLLAFEMTPILYEQHMHTPLCRHALGGPEEYAAVARERGLAGLVVTCHNPWPGGFMQGSRMRMGEWTEYLRLIERARAACAGWCDIRAGLEADYWPGHEDGIRELVESAPLHHVLGSVHPYEEYQAIYGRSGPAELQRNYFQHLAEAAESGLFDTLAHPDLVKNMIADWSVERALPVIEPALDRIAATGVAMELNTSGLNKRIPEMNPGPVMLREMARRGIPLVIGSDAHWPERAGADWEAALDQATVAGYQNVSFFLDLTRRATVIGTSRRSLRPRPSDPVSPQEWSLRAKVGNVRPIR